MCGWEYCHLFWDAISSSVHGTNTHNVCGSSEKEYLGIRQLWGLSSFFIKEIYWFLFPFFSNFLEVICHIWVGFILKDWELLVELSS